MILITAAQCLDSHNNNVAISLIFNSLSKDIIASIMYSDYADYSWQRHEGNIRPLFLLLRLNVCFLMGFNGSYVQLRKIAFYGPRSTSKQGFPTRDPRIDKYFS